MNASEPYQRANAAALRYLAYRPRSEAEVRTRLSGRFPPDLIDRVIEDLSHQGLTDDTKFAALWADHRSRLNPRSASAIRRELVSKGVAKELADDAVRDLDDGDAAYAAGAKYARRLDDSPYSTFRQRLWGHLRRRGFGSAVSRQTIDTLWSELQESSSRSTPVIGDS